MERCADRRGSLQSFHHLPPDAGAVHVSRSAFQADVIGHHVDQRPADVASERQHRSVADSFLRRGILQPRHWRGLDLIHVNFIIIVIIIIIIIIKLALTVHRCLQDKVPQYLLNYCVPVSEVISRQRLRSASRHHLLLIPRYRLSTFGRRAVALVGPTFWKSLEDELRTYSCDRFKPALKTFFFAIY